MSNRTRLALIDYMALLKEGGYGSALAPIDMPLLAEGESSN